MQPRTAKKAEQSRHAILEAAKKEFGERGVDGARTESIARAAGVNKAMLYYYFTDKETLYGAVLDDVFATRFQVLGSILESELPAEEKILRFARQHFDYVSGEDHYPRLVQYEMMRAAHGHSPHLPRLVESFFRPMMERVTKVIRQGIAERRLRPVDPLHLVLSIIGVNVFHVLSAPVLRGLPAAGPQASNLIAERRAATLDFIAASIFSDREEGIRLAARIVAEPAQKSPPRQQTLPAASTAEANAGRARSGERKSGVRLGADAHPSEDKTGVRRGPRDGARPKQSIRGKRP
ncbi:MAG: TetR/AcrR family transcriptional regulator [Candidatus Korobacteraceae bacterium]